jgi:hypothetical protein
MTPVEAVRATWPVAAIRYDERPDQAADRMAVAVVEAQHTGRPVTVDGVAIISAVGDEVTVTEWGARGG